MTTGPQGPVNADTATLQTLPLGGQATVSARLIDDCTGAGLPGEPVKFFVDSGPNAGLGLDTVTDADGSATMGTSSGNAGEDAWLATHMSGSYNVTTERFARIIWTKLHTVLVAKPALLSLVVLHIYGPLSATLSRTSPSAPVAGKVIQFSAGGTPVCQATTNASGVATCSGGGLLGLTLAGGYTATFAGDAYYAASSGSA
jgi:hypothetical protein